MGVDSNRLTIRAWTRRSGLLAATAFCAAALAFSSSLPQASPRPVFASIDFAETHAQWNQYGFQADKAILERWQSLLQRVSSLDTAEKLKQVNAFVHKALAYQLDQSLWGREDYWATPLETLARGRGDCEDYVIIQYVSLLNAGISDDKLRLIYVRARIGGSTSPVTRPHMVLGYYPEAGAEPILLDSLIEDILPASEQTDLTPVFSFNSSELWAGGTGASAGSATARLSPWRDVLNRMKREGVSLNVSR